jgi:hypothetical protein
MDTPAQATADPIPTDPTHAYWNADHPEHAAAVAEVQATLRAAPTDPRLSVAPPTGTANPNAPAEPDALAPYDPDAVTLPALPDGEAWDESGLGQFAQVAGQLGLSHAQATGLLDFYAAWAPRLGNLADPTIALRAQQAFEREATRLGLSPDQTTQVLDFHATYERGPDSAPPSDAAVSTLHALRAEWGAQFPDKLARAKTAVRSLGGAEIVRILEETGLGDDPRVVKMFERVGALLDRERTGGADASAPVEPTTLSRESAERLIRTILDDFKSAYYDNSHPRHTATVEHVRRLYARAYPSA